MAPPLEVARILLALTVVLLPVGSVASLPWSSRQLFIGLSLSSPTMIGVQN
jgi:hypothetical protein